MKIKGILEISLICSICFSCVSKKEIIPEFYDVYHSKIKVVSIDKRKGYYSIKGIDDLEDTLNLISKSKKVYSKVDNEKYLFLNLEVNKTYQLNILELYPRGNAGDFGRVFITVNKDTLWRGVLRDQDESRIRFYRVLRDYSRTVE